MNRTRIARLGGLAALGCVAVTLGVVVGGGRAAGPPSTLTGPMPMCDPGDICYSTTSTTSTTPTTTPTTSTTPTTPAGDPPVEAYFGAGGTQFGRVDEGVVATDDTGLAVRCARLGAERYESGFLTKGWSFFMSLRWCWNGKTVTSWDSWDRWVKNHVPFPVSLIYPLDWRLTSEAPPLRGLSQSSAFAQARVNVCPVKLPTCFTWYPWLRFSIDGQGHAFCQSDVRASIPDCKA